MSCSRWIDSDTLLYLCHHHDSQLDYCLHVPLQLHSYVLSIAITTQASRLLHTRVWLVNITRSPSLSQQSGLLLFLPSLLYARLSPPLAPCILHTLPIYLPTYLPTHLSVYLPANHPNASPSHRIVHTQAIRATTTSKIFATATLPPFCPPEGLWAGPVGSGF